MGNDYEVTNGPDPSRAQRLEARTDDAYRAIGRYVYEFSRLVFHMRSTTSSVFDKRAMAEVVMGRSTAQMIADGFFELCRASTTLNPDEDRVARSLSRKVSDLIDQRTELDHGDWLIGPARADDWDVADPGLARTRPARRDGPFEFRKYTIRDLEALSDEISEVRNFVGEYGALCVGRHGSAGARVGDFLVIVGTSVQRSGPKVGSLRVQYL